METDQYIGIDLHKAFFQACAMTRSGERTREEKYPRTSEGIAAWRARCSRECAWVEAHDADGRPDHRAAQRRQRVHGYAQDEARSRGGGEDRSRRSPSCRRVATSTPPFATTARAVPARLMLTQLRTRATTSCVDVAAGRRHWRDSAVDVTMADAIALPPSEAASTMRLVAPLWPRVRAPRLHDHTPCGHWQTQDGDRRSSYGPNGDSPAHSGPSTRRLGAPRRQERVPTHYAPGGCGSVGLGEMPPRAPSGPGALRCHQGDDRAAPPVSPPYRAGIIPPTGSSLDILG